MAGLAIEPAIPGAPRRTGWLTPLHRLCYGCDQLAEPSQGVLTVPLLATKALRLDYHQTLGGYPLVSEGKQPSLMEVG